MDIAVTRTGGFAGLSEQIGALNTTRLEAKTAQQVQQAVRSSGFFALPVSVAGDAVGADQYRYTITITEGDRHHAVTFDDDNSAATASLRKLMALVVGSSTPPSGPGH
jgi:hypothetical protein